MRLTRQQVEHLLLPGDAVVVHYDRPNVFQAGIEWWEAGTACHALSVVSGVDVVEDTIGGVARTNLDTYMRGQCRLTVKRAPDRMCAHSRGRAVGFLLDQVGLPYGWGSVTRALVATPLRRLVLPRAPRLGRALLRAFAAATGHSAPDCSALAVLAMREFAPKVLSEYPAEQVTPETLLRDPHLDTVAVWDHAVLDRHGMPHG